MPEIRHLKHFIAVAEAGGIRQASRHIHLSPASILRSVRQLEEQYSVKLFETQGKKLHLTLSGEYLLKEARTLVKGLEGLAPRLEQLEEIGSGALKVGLAPAVADLLMPAVTSRLISENPSIRISTTIDTAAVLNTKLKNHELDLAIALENVLIANDRYSFTHIYEGTPIWVVRKGHPLLAVEKPKMEEVGRYPIVAQHLEQYYTERVQETLRTAGLLGSRIMPVSHCNNFRLLCDIVQQTDAILMGGLLNFKTRTCSQEMCRLHLPLDLPRVRFTAAYPKIPSPSPLAKRYVSYITEEVSAIIEKYPAG
ncbi:LysR family transcriptional regulator [Pontiellaceae bacterium B12219]|nr:LysR family transcriptional regulator [Pontiellaceae bacterium B12219]